MSDAEQNSPMSQAPMSQQRRSELRDVYRAGLLEDVVPFWLRCGLDGEHGGVMTCLDRDGGVVDTDKGVWQQGRFAWLLGELVNNVEPRDEWLQAAISIGEFLERYGFDKTDGRMWFHLDQVGRPLRKRRYAFSESFAAIAFGELYQATGEQRYRDLAENCFRQFIRHNIAPPAALAKHTGVRPTQGLGFPMIAIATAQELRDSIGLVDARDWIDFGIKRIRSQHMHEDIECVMETVAPGGARIDHFEGRTLNPGHAIEGAWFILLEAKRRRNARLRDVGCQILDWMWKRGWDEQHGGLLYFVDVDGGPVHEYWHDMKFWWPQNELIIATLLAYLLTGEPRYAEWHRMAHDWAYRHFPDLDSGEWLGYLHRDGTPSSTLKGNLWKGPFHIPRMQLMCWKLLDEYAEQPIGGWGAQECDANP